MNGLHRSKAGCKTFNILPPDHWERTDDEDYELSHVIAALENHEIIRWDQSEGHWVEFFRMQGRTLYRTRQMQEAGENPQELTAAKAQGFSAEFTLWKQHLNQTVFNVLEGSICFRYEHLSNYCFPYEDEQG